MTKRSAEEILCSVEPVKSVKRYNKAWEDFEAFVGSDEREKKNLYGFSIIYVMNEIWQAARCGLFTRW